MTAQIAIGLTLPSMCAVTTNAGALFKHRGANAVPAFEVRRPLRSSGLLLRVFGDRTVLLGAAGGAFLGLSGVAVKAITGLVERGATPGAAPWLAMAIAAGIAVQILAVGGLREGEAVPVIALTGVTANIANIAGGRVVFGDVLGHGPLGLTGESLAVCLVVVGNAMLAGPAVARSSVRSAARSPRLV